jgi:hypothetical protein
MKNPIKILLACSKIKIPAAIRSFVLAGSILCLALNAWAGVQVMRFDPPLAVSCFTEPPENLLWNTTAVDFNVDDAVDFRLVYGWGMMGAYFNAPTRFATRVSRHDFIISRGGSVGAVPLNSIIGSNIVSAISTNYYAWAPGTTNTDDLTEALGDRQTGVITANLTVGQPGPIITFSNGILVTNYYYGGPGVSGDPAGKQGVVALQFYINGQAHYGYIHFDFRGDPNGYLSTAGGVIYGWAYETDPGVPIQAVPLSPPLPNPLPPPPIREPRPGPHRLPEGRPRR